MLSRPRHLWRRPRRYYFLRFHMSIRRCEEEVIRPCRNSEGRKRGELVLLRKVSLRSNGRPTRAERLIFRSQVTHYVCPDPEPWPLTFTVVSWRVTAVVLVLQVGEPGAAEMARARHMPAARTRLFAVDSVSGQP